MSHASIDRAIDDLKDLICTICNDPDCWGNYTHFQEEPNDELPMQAEPKEDK